MSLRAIAWLIGAAVAIVAAVILTPLFGSQGHQSGPAGLAGQPAPAFGLSDDLGKPVSLADYRGRVVIVNLWATWCPPCRAEMPDLQRLSDAYVERGLSVVGVDEGESAQQARSFAQSLRIRYPIWIDDQQRYGRAFVALGMPTTVIVGRDGKVVRGFDGALTYQQMRAAVDDLVPTR